MAQFIATDLTKLDLDSTSQDQTDIESNGSIYRQLDPQYFAWLRHRMEKARTCRENGTVSAAAFDALCARFNAIQDLAIALFGESTLLDAIRLLEPQSYQWPGRTRERPDERMHAEKPEETGSLAPRCSPEDPTGIPKEISLDGLSQHSYPAADPKWSRFNQPVSKYALAQVDAIHDQAMALGWTEARLYQTRGRFAFPCGDDYGVVCFIRREQRLGEVTDKTIEIICPGGHSQRFYRKEVNS